MSQSTTTQEGTTAMSKSVTICGAVFTDPRILAIHAKAIADSFPRTNWEWPSKYSGPSELIAHKGIIQMRERNAFWKLQGDILASMAGE